METVLVPETRSFESAIAGCIVGTAVGDAIGLPAEGLSATRQRALFGSVSGHRSLLGRGMVSDDTEHTLLVARALIASCGEVVPFERELARNLRRWLLCIPAGVGWATLRAGLKLCLGVPPDRSGVYSAGNGPAMRSALIGVHWGADPDRLAALVRASTRLTHTDSRAEFGALAVAVAASCSARCGTGMEDTPAFLGELRALLPGETAARELLTFLDEAAGSAGRGETAAAFALRVLGLHGYVGGYVYHTVPVALQAVMHHPNDFRAAVQDAVSCGGDTDTLAAIVGAIVGARVGPEGIPPQWRDGIRDWSCRASLIAALTACLSGGDGPAPHGPSVPATLARNALFLCVVLCHGMRRLLPPY